MMFKVGLVFTFTLASCMAEAGYPSLRPDEQLSYDQGYSYQNPHDQLSGDEIFGVAGRDYPIFREVPQTRFECEQQQYPGYYADPEAECQAFHICQRGGHKDSFLCPNGTLFNQARLVCEWWHTVDCSRAQSFYSINEAVAKAMEEADRRIQLAAEEKLSQGYLRESNARHWNKHNQQNAKQGWNGAPARHNVMSDFAKNLPYEAPATSIRPVYGAPEVSAKSNVDNGQWNRYNQQNAKQGWNDTPVRHNAVSTFAKNLPYQAPATSIRPVYGAPEISAKSNVDNGPWNRYNQQNVKQGWNDTPARHNVVSDFAKNLPYEAAATRPVYGAPEVSANSNVDNGPWNRYNQQNAKQGWNDTPTQHNVVSDFAKNLPYEAPATSARPVYGAPEVSANSLPHASNHGDSYSQEENYMITDAKFGKPTTKSNFAEPTNVYLPA